MFGALRYVLAIMVVAQHVWAPFHNWSGVYAVFGFYVVSGYLMALVLNEVYPFTPAGTLRFLLNRALRIYAPYIVAVVFAAWVAAENPLAAGKIDPAMVLPANGPEWVATLLILGLVPEYIPRLISVSWSLRVELVMYGLMAVGLARGLHATLFWYAASLGYTLFFVLSAAPFDERYYTVQAAALPFALGALAYHLRPRLTWRRHLPLATTLFALNWGVAHLFGTIGTDYGMYLSLLVSVYLVAVLRSPPAGLPTWLTRVDRWLGNLSYPIFLLHWPIAVLVAVNQALPTRPSWELFLAALPMVHLAAVALWLAVEWPLGWLRSRVRGRSVEPAGLGQHREQQVLPTHQHGRGGQRTPGAARGAGARPQGVAAGR
jgi:peptidoglycan/LPS O-acetylase OafA/YrhL